MTAIPAKRRVRSWPRDGTGPEPRQAYRFQLSTGEGIGTALQTGLLAASAAAEAIKKGSKASDIYLKEIGPIREFMKEIYTFTKKGRYIIEENPQRSVSALVEMVKTSLKPNF